MTRDINEYDAVRLKQFCGISPRDPLPKKVVDEYWAFKIINDRGGQAITLNDLAWMVRNAGCGAQTEREKNPTPVDLWRQGKLKKGDSLTVKVGDKPQNAQLSRVTSKDEIYVVVAGEVEERLVKVEQVALAAA